MFELYFVRKLDFADFLGKVFTFDSPVSNFDFTEMIPFIKFNYVLLILFYDVLIHIPLSPSRLPIFHAYQHRKGIERTPDSSHLMLKSV